MNTRNTLLAGPDEERRGSCPLGGEKTASTRGVPAVGSLAMEEFETLVRNEWRRTLGRRSYDRNHSPTLVRALILYGLEPDDPRREAAAERLLARHRRRMIESGLRAGDVASEFWKLCGALWEVLRGSGMPVNDAYGVTGRIDAKVLAAWRA